MQTEPLDIRTSAGRIDAQLVSSATRSHGTVVLCHGFPSGSARNLDDPGYPGLARELAALGFAAATFSFRGCYGSDGNFSLSGWMEDLRAVVDTVADRAPSPLMVAGSSLGGAVTVLVATDDERISAVATLAAPAVLDELGGSQTQDAFIARAREIGVITDPDFPPDADAWADDFRRLRPEDAAARLSARPLLVVHGTEDDAVPVEHGERLAAHGGLVTKVILTGAGHQLRRDPVAVRVLFSWLASQAGARVPRLLEASAGT